MIIPTVSNSEENSPHEDCRKMRLFTGLGACQATYTCTIIRSRHLPTRIHRVGYLNGADQGGIADLPIGYPRLFPGARPNTKRGNAPRGTGKHNGNREARFMKIQPGQPNWNYAGQAVPRTLDTDPQLRTSRVVNAGCVFPSRSSVA